MKRKIFGNPLGQVFLILAIIAGLAGAGYFIFKVITLVGFENFGALFEGEKALRSTYAFLCIAVCVPFLLVALIANIVGLAARVRSVGVLSVIFVLLGLLLQGVAYVLGFSEIATYFERLDFSQILNAGDLLVTFCYLNVAAGFVLDLVAVICAAARKRVPAIIFAVLGLLCFLDGAYFYVWPLFGNPAAGEVFVLFDALVDGGIAEIPFIGVLFLIARGAFIALVGLSIFFLCLSRVKEKVAKTSRVETKTVDETHHEVKESKKDDKRNDDAPKAEIIERKDRIIIEIR